MDSIVNFYNNNTEISIAIGVAVAILFFIKPKEIGKILGAIAVIILIAYLITALIDVVHKGTDKKNEAATRTDRAYSDSENENR